MPKEDDVIGFMQSALERKIAQQERIFNKFPRLHSIRFWWRDGFDDFKVVNTDEEGFGAFLASKCQAKVWITKRFKDAKGTDRVFLGADQHWARALINTLAPGVLPLYIVVGEPAGEPFEGWLSDNPTKPMLYTIYRPKDGSDGLVEDLFTAAYIDNHGSAVRTS